MKENKTEIPILDVDYLQRRIEHLNFMLSVIYDTGGTIQTSDMNSLNLTLNEIRVQLDTYTEEISKFKDKKERTEL